MMLILTPQDTHQLSVLSRGNFGWMTIEASLLQWAQRAGFSPWPELGAERLHSWKPASAKASPAARGSAPALLRDWQSSESSFLCEPSRALPAAVDQHDEALPDGSVTHSQLDLPQRHLSPAARHCTRLLNTAIEQPTSRQKPTFRAPSSSLAS